MRSLFPSLIILFICWFYSDLAAQYQNPVDLTERYKVFDTYEQLQAHIAKYRGQTVVVNFWATYCAPCVKEVPYFNQLQEKYRKNNVKVIMVNLDFKSQLKQRLDKYLDTNPSLDLEIVVLADQDADSWVPKVTPDWDGGLPFTMVLQNNTIKDTHRQEFESFEDLEKFVTPHIPPKPVLASKRR